MSLAGLPQAIDLTADNPEYQLLCVTEASIIAGTSINPPDNEKSPYDLSLLAARGSAIAVLQAAYDVENPPTP